MLVEYVVGDSVMEDLNNQVAYKANCSTARGVTGVTINSNNLNVVNLSIYQQLKKELIWKIFFLPFFMIDSEVDKSGFSYLFFFNLLINVISCVFFLYKFSPLIGALRKLWQTDQPTNWPTNQHTGMRSHRKVRLSINRIHLNGINIQKLYLIIFGLKC